MCWQCVRRPDEYLHGAELIHLESYDDECPYPPITFRWGGKIWRTNPDADWLFAGKANPGDVDIDGIPYFEEVA